MTSRVVVQEKGSLHGVSAVHGSATACSNCVRARSIAVSMIRCAARPAAADVIAESDVAMTIPDNPIATIASTSDAPCAPPFLRIIATVSRLVG
jgi:hypothetical protein